MIRTTRRKAALFASVLLIALGNSLPASAHGLGGRADLPVPRSLFVFGATLALVISFVLLSALWKEPRLQGETRSVPLPLQAVLRSAVVEWIVRSLSLLFFLVVLVGALGGSRSRNLAPVAVFVWFWVGLAFLHAFFGNLWATLSPWDTLARILGVGEGKREYPRAWGMWPGTCVLFAFVWMELVDPWGASARPLGIVILAYTIVTLVCMSVFGRENWNRGGEGFAIYFALFSRISPFARNADGRVVLRPPLAGLPGIDARPGFVPFVVCMLGSTTFDGASRLSIWTQRLDLESKTVKVAANSVGLVVIIVLVWIAYELAIRVAVSVSGTERRALSVRFVHSLIPIAFVYVVAHYFSYLLIEGQQGLALISDPFGAGWNLFGTAAWQVNLKIVSVNTVWYVQVFAIVSGHIAGVILAHDRAVAMWEPKVAVRTQYAMLAVMVLFTAVGLFILSGG